MGLTTQERDKLFETREKIDRIVKISTVINQLERCGQSEKVSREEGVRNMLHHAVFSLAEQDVKDVIEFVFNKIKQTKMNLEAELAGLKSELL